MAGTTALAAGTASFRWWYLPSWLGLDAPCVVTTWTWAISQSSELPLSFRPAAALFLVAWTVYLSDRLVDVARCRDWSHATGRLRFGRDYRLLFLGCLSLCLCGIVALLVAGLPVAVIQRAAFVALGLSLHILVFIVPVIVRDKLPGKEFGVGLFFALGASACLGYTPAILPMLVSVALVVAFNCLVIAAKDTESDRANDPGGASRWWPSLHRDLRWSGAALTIAVSVCAILAGETLFYVATAAAFLGLTVLLCYAHKLSGDAVRAVADFALFTPLLVIGITTALQ